MPLRGYRAPRRDGLPAAVDALLRHLAGAGFTGASTGAGSAPARPRPEDVLPGIGATLRELHEAAAGFRAAPGTRWRPWYGRALGDRPRRVLGHCDTTPAHVLVLPGGGIAFAGWGTAGPVDPLVDLAQACRSNAGLSDAGLPGGAADSVDAVSRGRRTRLLCDGYGAGAAQRAEVLDLLLALAVADAAEHTRSVPAGREREAAEAVAGGVRDADWILRHRRLLAGALA